MDTCERCRQEITDPNDEVVAAEVISEQDFGGEPTEPALGRRVHFHRRCFEETASHYRPVDFRD